MEAVYPFVFLGGVGFVAALLLALAFATTQTRVVLLVALGVALYGVADLAGVDSEDCEGECYGDIVRLSNGLGWGLGVAVGAVVRALGRHGRRLS